MKRSDIKEAADRVRAMLTEGEMEIFKLSEREMCLIKGALDNEDIETLSETWSISKERTKLCIYHACYKLIAKLSKLGERRNDTQNLKLLKEIIENKQVLLEILNKCPDEQAKL